jgi:hypothetical protein
MPLVEFTAIVFALTVLTLASRYRRDEISTSFDPHRQAVRSVDPIIDCLQRACPRTVCLHDFRAQLQVSQGRHFDTLCGTAKRKAALRRLCISKLMFVDQANYPLPNRRFAPEEDLLTYRSITDIELE